MVSATSTRKVLGQPAMGAGGAPATRVPRGRRRSRGQLVLGVLLIAGCAAAGSAVYASADSATTVVVAARDIPVGAQLTQDDLAAAELSGAGVTAISGGDAGLLLGQTATTAIPSGALLHADMVQQDPPPAEGEVSVGLALEPGRLPAELTAGRDVRVLLVPAAQEAGSDPEGQALAEVARVLSVSADPSGMWLVSVQVPQESADAVSAAAAVGRVSLSMLPVSEGD